MSSPISRSAVSGEHFSISAHLLEVSLPSNPSRRRLRISRCRSLILAAACFFLFYRPAALRPEDRGFASRGAQACLSRAQRLQSVSHLDLDQLFKLLALGGNLFSSHQRVTQLPFGGAIVKRQTD